VTAKPKGIGLGLAMARRAMEQQGGSLSFERGAAGSRFTIRLPGGQAC
jgi:signal transduction histidine kinase